MVKQKSKRAAAPVANESSDPAPNRAIRILTAGAKGGPGKSFLAKNLAAAAANEGYSVCTVDFDTQRTLSKWIKRREVSGAPIITNFEGDPDDATGAASAIAIRGFDLVFIDTPPSIDHYPETMKTLARGVDLVLVPTKVGISDTESAQELLAVLSEWEVQTLVVLNLVKINARRHREKAKSRIINYSELCGIEIPDYSDFLTVDEVGLGATEISKCNGAEAIEAVWTDVKRRIKLSKQKAGE